MPNANANDLRGANRLLVDAVAGTTDLVEAVHAHSPTLRQSVVKG